MPRPRAPSGAKNRTRVELASVGADERTGKSRSGSSLPDPTPKKWIPALEHFDLRTTLKQSDPASNEEMKLTACCRSVVSSGKGRTSQWRGGRTGRSLSPTRYEAGDRVQLVSNGF
jgi:hypothetical protein